MLKNIFWLNYLFHSSKEVFLSFWKIEFLRQVRPLQNWKFCKIEENFWQRKCFSTILGIRQEFDRRDLTKIVKILYYLKLCFENIFWLNYLFHSSKEVFLHNFRQFLENWIFDRNSTGADLTNIVKILYYLTLCFENIFWLNYLFHSSKEVFLHNFRQFLENWILTEIRQVRTLQI